MAPEIKTGLSSASGIVPGPYHNESMVCEFAQRTNFQGSIWLGGQPLGYSTPVLMAQFILIFIVSRLLYIFLKPLKQSPMSAQIITGIIMGPSVLAQDKRYAEIILPPDGRLVLGTVADVGFMLHLFLLGVQTDTSMLKQAGKKAALIGSTGFAMAYILGGLAWFAISHIVVIDDKILTSLPFIVTLNSISSFPVITSLLADLNILNSEIGRLATFTSMVCDLWSYFGSLILFKIGVALHTTEWGLMWSSAWIVAYVIVIVFVLRPLVFWMAKQMPEGKPMKESHFMSIMVIVLGCGFFSEVLGQHSGLGSFMLGMIIPDGPPLGESLVYKLEAMSTGLLLPVKFVLTGLNTNLLSIEGTSAMVVEITIISGYLGKFLGTLLTALYSSVRFQDALSLSLIMCCKGIVDIALYCAWKDEGVVGRQEFALLIITMLIVTGMVRPLVRYLYDPSKRYMVRTRSNILRSHDQNTDLRILVCVHNEDNVPPIINLLEASNPTKQSPISVFVLNLLELKGRAAAILVPNYRRGKLVTTAGNSKHIANAFTYYAQHNQGRVTLQHFTAVAPFASMHDDVCMLALDKGVTIVIVPFHKHWTIDGTVGAIFPSIRTVNRNVINKAPCSVGVLVDRTSISGSWSVLTGQSLFRVALLFLGGADDREAFAYARRMADHPYVMLTVVWVRPWAHSKFSKELSDTLVDDELMNEFKDNAMSKERIVFKEEIVEDAEGTTRVIHSMESAHDLFIVGRYHDPESPLTSGLTEWSESPELGVIGDMLATWDFRFSVLVVQQQPATNHFKISQDPFATQERNSRHIGSMKTPV
ncbi:unnamed protein product [Camellia sinensis]